MGSRMPFRPHLTGVDGARAPKERPSMDGGERAEPDTTPQSVLEWEGPSLPDRI